MIEEAVEQQAGFKISELNPETAAKSCESPVFFLHGNQDDFILPEHSQKNHASYAGANKILKGCEGDHNTPRPHDINDEVAAFLKQHL